MTCVQSLCPGEDRPQHAKQLNKPAAGLRTDGLYSEASPTSSVTPLQGFLVPAGLHDGPVCGGAILWRGRALLLVHHRIQYARCAGQQRRYATNRPTTLPSSANDSACP